MKDYLIKVLKTFKGTDFASLYLLHKDYLEHQFEGEIDENSNRLVLALSAYFESEWFTIGCTVYSTFEALIIKPLCELLDIDDHKMLRNAKRNWVGVKSFFEEKFEELKALSDKRDSILEKLLGH